ncbi:MAG: hypothetical protein GY946_08940 [bacterium]|nr:hypothetical protein [bacterium]
MKLFGTRGAGNPPGRQVAAELAGNRSLGAKQSFGVQALERCLIAGRGRMSAYQTLESGGFGRTEAKRPADRVWSEQIALYVPPAPGERLQAFPLREPKLLVIAIEHAEPSGFGPGSAQLVEMLTRALGLSTTEDHESPGKSPRQGW